MRFSQHISQVFTMSGIVFFFSILGLSSAKSPSEGGDQRFLLALIESTWDADNFGKILGIIVRILMILCVILLWVDCVSRFQGKPKRWMAVLHFIVFFYGSSSWIFIGNAFAVGYRGFNFPMFIKFYTYLFNHDGYFGSGTMEVFKPIKSEAGVEYTGFVHYWNVLFIEIIVYFILRIMSCVMVLSGKLKKNNKMAHLVDSIFTVYALSWGFPFLAHALNWFKQNSMISEMNDTRTDKFKLGGGSSVIGWLIAIYMLLEVLWQLAQVCRWAFKGKNMILNKGGKTGQVSNSNGRGAQVIDGSDSRLGCSTEDVYIDIAYMHMKKMQAAKSPITMFFIPGRILKWALLVWLAHSFHHKPRTISWVWTIVCMLFMVWTILALKAINKPAGILFLVEDVLLFLWHLSQSILWSDLGTEKKDLGLNWVWFYVVVIQIAFFACLVIELILVFLAIKGSKASGDKANLNSEDVKLDELSGNELDNKIQTYNTMKVNQATNQPKQ